MRPSPAWRQELRRAASGAAALLLAGLVTGWTLPLLLAGAVGYAGWHLWQLRRLEAWLTHPKRVPPPDAPGVWGEVYARLRDVQRKKTKRKKRVRKILARFRQAAQAMPDGALILRADAEIEWFNRAAIRMLGLHYPSDVGQRVANLVRHPELVEYVSVGRYEEPISLPSPVNEEQQLLVRIVPYGSDRRLMLVRDITRLHRLELMRKDFVANVSHELRSPLTVVLGYLESLEDDPDAPAAWRRPVDRMHQQARRMQVIVEDLLRLSQLESTPGAAAREPVRIADMTERICADAISLDDGAHRILLEPGPPCTVLGDWNELYSALSNLVFNAVQYTPAGGSVHVGWSRDEEGVCLEVRDTGIGIEPHHVPRLTERFYRVDEARSRALGGTGLGLAIVKHVLVRHEAGLRIESAPGKGSTFTCVFPAVRVLAQSDRAAVAAGA